MYLIYTIDKEIIRAEDIIEESEGYAFFNCIIQQEDFLLKELVAEITEAMAVAG